jgi:hypothetical protein
MKDDGLTAAVEAAVDRDARLSRLEEAVKKLQPKKKDGWEKLQAAAPLISGLLVVIFGFILTGSVNNAIQRQQLQLSNVKEMRELLAQLSSADEDVADSAAFTLSAFGRPAVPALMSALAAGGDVRAPAAEQALRAIGLGDPVAVCEPTRKLLDSRSGLVSWIAYLSALRLLADVECGGARASVQAFATALERTSQKPDDPGASGWRVAPSPPLDPILLGQLQKELARTLKVLRP